VQSRPGYFQPLDPGYYTIGNYSHIGGLTPAEYRIHMIRFFRFSQLALGYIALSVPVLAILPIPLWYARRMNISTFRAYVLWKGGSHG
jgi:hypothetical protein